MFPSDHSRDSVANLANYFTLWTPRPHHGPRFRAGAHGNFGQRARPWDVEYGSFVALIGHNSRGDLEAGGVLLTVWDVMPCGEL